MSSASHEELEQAFLAEATLGGYQRLLRAFGALRYSCVPFTAFDPNRRHLILRHDVDISLSLSRNMAEAEHAEGCRATYFVLLSSEFYNVASKVGREWIRDMVAMGHDIALHFDTSVYVGCAARLEEAALAELEVLEAILGCRVTVTAFHRPSTVYAEALGRRGLFAGRLHAYAPEFFVEAGYVSDSLGFWAHGHPLDHPHLKLGKGLQLLTHPYLWSGEAGQDARSKIEVELSRRAARLEAEAAGNFRVYGPAVL